MSGVLNLGAKVVMCEMQSNGRFQVLQLLREGVRQSRSKNVVRIMENPAKSPIKTEKCRRKRLASICYNLPFFSGLRRLRQDLVNLLPRLEGRRSFRLSYGRAGYVDSKSFVASDDTILEALTFYWKADVLP